MTKVKLLLITLIIFCIAVPVYASELNNGNYVTIIDENGNTVYITGRNVKAGDQFLTENNQRFEVTGIDGNTARARFLGQVNLSQYGPANTNGIAFLQGLVIPRIAEAQSGGKVAIYHTHTDESYVPSDGVESKLGNGGIFQVGQSFADALKANGITPILSQAKHDPHDDMAYERSRRTAKELLSKQPDAVFDVHRDAVPPQVYQANIAGKDVTKVQLVVGKFGPTGKQIEDYAMKIKAAADQKHPGLIKGIFFAKGGDYNQDLHPRSILLEVGAHTNTKEQAERGIALFADVIPMVLGQTSQGGGAPAGTGVGTVATGASGATKSIGWIVGLLVVGAAAFLFLSTGSMKEAGSKLKQFGTTEFANFLGSLKKKSKNKEPNDRDE